MSVIHNSLEQLRRNEARGGAFSRGGRGGGGGGSKRLLLLAGFMVLLGVVALVTVLWLRSNVTRQAPPEPSQSLEELRAAAKQHRIPQPAPQPSDTQTTSQPETPTSMADATPGAGAEPEPTSRTVASNGTEVGLEFAETTTPPVAEQDKTIVATPEQPFAQDQAADNQKTLAAPTPPPRPADVKTAAPTPSPPAHRDPDRELTPELEDHFTEQAKRNVAVQQVERDLARAMRAGDADGAAVELGRLESMLGDESPTVLRWKGYLALADGAHAEAEALYRAALAAAPENLDARYNLILSLLKQGKRDEARARYAGLRADHPQNTRVLAMEPALK